MTGIVIITTFLALVGGLYFWYISIVTKRNKAQEAFAGIDVQLKKRADLIANVLVIAKKFMEHEKALLEQVTQLRAQVTSDQSAKTSNPVDIKERFAIEEQLHKSMGQLNVAVENYPELKSDSHMLNAQNAYKEVEADIAASRRFYNSAVGALHNSIQIFPGNIIARKIGVSELPFYETSSATKLITNASDVL